MEGHAIRRLILNALWVAPLVAIALWQLSPFAAIGVIMLSHALVLYPTLRPTSQWLGPVVTSFATARREVWLTIDDGPSPHTADLLDALDRSGARATFFIIGRKAEEHPEITAEILRRGHDIGNHSHTHPSGGFWALGPAAIADEIDRCSETLSRITDALPRWFRAPVGMKNPFVHPIIHRRELPLIAWTTRGFDAVAGNPEGILTRITRDIRPGAIVLLHEGRKVNVEIIERLLKHLEADGYSTTIPARDQLVCGREKTSR